MRTVVVQAHPLDDSFNAAVLERVTIGLTAAGEDSAVFRLGAGERPTPSDLTDGDRLVLVYPTWWGGQPAVLLDWLQEVLEVAGALASVQRLVAVTSLGSTRLLNRIQGEWGRANLHGRVLAACADGATFEWVALYKIDRQPQTEIDSFLDRVEARFAQRSSPLR